jgi:hypothetical protein
MAISGGPDIVEDGLVLHLDAADRNSYPGTGTKWYDLCGNTNFTLYNGPVFNNNRFSCDGSNDSIISDSNFALVGSDITISIGFYMHNYAASCPCTGAGGLFNIDGFSYSNYLYFFHGGGTHSFLIQGDSQGGGGRGIVAVAAGNLLDSWYFLTFTYNNTSYLFKGYINGSYVGQSTFTHALDMTNKIYLSNYIKSCGNCYTESDIAFLSINRKELSASEVLQNYNATKGRYGL